MFTAECYSGDGAYKTYKNDGPTKQCYTSKYQPCNFECESVPCAGSIHTIFVYKLGARKFVLLPYLLYQPFSFPKAVVLIKSRA